MIRWVLGVFLIPFMVMAADVDDWGDVSDVQVVKPPSTKTVNYWDQHFYGGLSGTWSIGQNHTRLTNEVKLGFSDRWALFKVAAEATYRQQIVDTKYEKTTSFPRTVELGKTTLRTEKAQFRQAYVDIYPVQNVTISLGRQLNVWGQLDIFSPVDFLLPIDFNPGGFSLTKADNRLPQTTAKVSIYPLQGWELSGYYFPYFEESELFKLVDLTDSYRVYNGDRYYTTKYVPTGRKQSSYAFRSVWYLPAFTAGITLYNGFNNVFPVFRQAHVTDSFFKDEYGYYPKRGVGVELTWPLGKLSLKAEATLSDSLFDLSQKSGIKANTAIRNWLIQHNNGYLDVPIFEAFLAVGVDADFDMWFYNIYLMNISFIKNPTKKDFWTLYEAAYGKPDFPSIPVFPTLNIGRYFNAEKKGAYGLAAGYFTGSLGLYLYVSNQLTESLTWGLSGDVGFNFSDIALLNRQNNNDGSSTKYLFIEPKVTTGLSYRL